MFSASPATQCVTEDDPDAENIQCIMPISKLTYDNSFFFSFSLRNASIELVQCLHKQKRVAKLGQPSKMEFAGMLRGDVNISSFL